MRSLLFVVCLLWLSQSVGQSIDVSGSWEGTSKIPNGQLSLKLTIGQNGNFVTGTVWQQGSKPADSSAYVFNGKVTGKKLSLTGLKYLYKSNVLNCLPKIELTYSGNRDQPTLTGKWKSNLALGGCPPLMSGRIDLKQINKSKPAASPISKVNEPKQPDGNTVEDDDWIGQAMVDKLTASQYYGVIIGINEYQSNDIQSLDHPISDASDLAEILEQQYHFNSSNLHLLKNPTRAQLIETFDKLSNQITPEDNLLIFYAGHGIWDEKLQQGYWLPADAKMTSKAQWLSNSTLRDYIGGINSKHSLLITDACFSGSILKERAVVYAKSKAILEMYKLPSRKAITSGTLKTVPDKSVFFKYLLKNLTTNDSKLLSAETLFRNFKIAVVNNSPNGQVPQYGAISQTGDEGGEFIFLKR